AVGHSTFGLPCHLLSLGGENAARVLSGKSNGENPLRKAQAQMDKKQKVRNAYLFCFSREQKERDYGFNAWRLKPL
ncbi:hypothetical protein ACI495_004863, partial [Vibrio vulnificus]